MERFGRIVFIMLTTVVCCMSAQAAKFKGYRKGASEETMTLKESLDRFEETPKDFLILLQRHSGFYLFPKKPEYSSQVREFLNSRMKSKKTIQLQIIPTTSQILNLSDLE